MQKNNKKHGAGKAAAFITLWLICFTALITVLLRGHNIAQLNPKGMVAHEQLNLAILAIGIMLVIAIPTIFLLYFTAWKYRESNTRASRDLNVRHGKLLDVTMWSIPVIIAVILASVMWPATHRLEPQKTIAADAKPLTIQVVSLRWKWLFIYPDLHIATVNFVQVPVDTPIQFELTADDAPMSSFWIPNLGGMLYTMTGHTNKLNLIANAPGDYPGSSAEINGAGFADMKFTARASNVTDFDQWVQEVRQAPNVLSDAEYEKLLQPSENNPVTLYANADSGLYDTVLMKYMAGHNHQPAEGQSEHE
jgi:cytochrome o ubiquinol oxidase subunit 2